MMAQVDGISGEMWQHSNTLPWALQAVKDRVDKDQQPAAIKEILTKFKGRPKSTAKSAIKQQQYLNQSPK